MAEIITNAGNRPSTKAGAPSRKELVLEIAKRLRSAKSDEDYADSLAAALELARLPDGDSEG